MITFCLSGIFDFQPRNKPTAESHTKRKPTYPAFNSGPVGRHSRVKAHLKEEELFYPVTGRLFIFRFRFLVNWSQVSIFASIFRSILSIKKFKMSSCYGIKWLFFFQISHHITLSVKY